MQTEMRTPSRMVTLTSRSTIIAGRGACGGFAPFSLLALQPVVWPAAAQDYPTRPVRAIVAVGAGGTGDIMMRVLGEELHRRWGQPIVVENRPGGASNIGARACAEAPADGYTICIMPGEPLAYNQFLYKKLSFDPANDFEPITNLFFNTQALVVNAALKVKTVDELVALSKARAGTLSYTAPSLPLALYLEELKRERGADWVSIPFRGGGDTTNAVLSGSTPIAFLGAPSSAIAETSPASISVSSRRRVRPSRSSTRSARTSWPSATRLPSARS